MSSKSNNASLSYVISTRVFFGLQYCPMLSHYLFIYVPFNESMSNYSNFESIIVTKRYQINRLIYYSRENANLNAKLLHNIVWYHRHEVMAISRTILELTFFVCWIQKQNFIVMKFQHTWITDICNTIVKIVKLCKLLLTIIVI